ncbi:RHS repeat-associated core domain-containing protein [Pseudomonas sp. NPDC089996]|uniref:RHS repeat-associated core domain-containing protein n=1 Tax=Pseudomonas sp. NPDC089996 TaxID=3364474 RepID=UPI00382EE9B2
MHILKSEHSVRQLIRHDRQVLVEWSAVTRMAWGDKQASVLGVKEPEGGHGISYSAYGAHEFSAESAGIIGFSGYYFDALSTHYLLGNGYRSYSPRMMRFLSPDSLSPFGRGGLNAYGYCGGDPINRIDPDGQCWESVLTVKVKKFIVKKKSHSVQGFMKSRVGEEREYAEIADFTANFKKRFDATPTERLNLGSMDGVPRMEEVEAMLLYRSMKKAKSDYMALANDYDFISRGVFPEQKEEVVKRVQKLQRVRDPNIPMQADDREFQRAHEKNVKKIDGWLKAFKARRDAHAIGLADRLRRQV